MAGSIATLAALIQLGCFAPRSTSPYMVVETPGGELGRVPVRIRSRKIPYDGLGEYPLVAFRPGEAQVPSGTACAGMSGSPVYSSSGELLGGFYSGVQPGARGAPIVLQPRDQIMLGFALGRARGNRVPPTEAIETESTDVAPGHSVGFFWLWGDLKRGVTGAVTYREGDEILAMAHSATKRFTGPVVGALARTPVIEWISHGMSDSTYCGWGGVIGTVTYDGLRGVYARLGVAPPYVAMRCTIYDDSGDIVIGREYFAAKDPNLCEASLQSALEHTLSALDGLRLKASTGMRGEIHVDSELSFVIDAMELTCFESELDDCWKALVRAGVLAMNTIEIRIWPAEE